MKHNAMVSRRQLMTLGMAGLAGLLLPRRPVLADSHTLEDQLRGELEITAEHFRSEGAPQTARSRSEDAFIEEITNPVLAELPQLGATAAEIQSLRISLDQVQSKVGEITEDWASQIVNVQSLMDAFKLDLEAQTRLAQPTFPPPFFPTFNIDIGSPTPATSQTPAEMLGNLRAGGFPVNPWQISLDWNQHPLQIHAHSEFFDELLMRASIEANDFLDADLNLKSPAGRVNQRVEWRFFQNGALNELTGDFLGEFNRDNSNEVVFPIVNVTFRF